MLAPASRALVASCIATACLFMAAPASAAPPSNDNFAGAQDLGTPPSQKTGNNTEATVQPNEPAAHGTKSIWFKWSANQTGRFRLDVCDTLPAADLAMAVYTGAAVGSLTNVTAAQSGGGSAPLDYPKGACADGELPAVVFDATAGQTYRIAIGADSCCGSPTSTNIVLKLSKSEVNDNFAEATDIGPLPAQVSGSNVFASREQSEPTDHGEASVWWKWTADQPGRFRADVCDTLPAADLRMGVYTGPSVSGLANVAAAGTGGVTAPLSYNTGACASGGHPALVFDAAVGQTYYIAVGADSCCGTEVSPNLVLKVRKSELNDNFAEAATITGAPAAASGSNVFASREQFEPADHGEASVWWTWTATQTGPFSVDTCSTLPAADSTIGVYTGSAVEALAAVPTQAGACASAGASARFSAVAGQAYHFAVGAQSCCSPVVSPGIVLTLRDTDCDQANLAVLVKTAAVKKANAAVKKAAKKAKRSPTKRNRKNLKKLKTKLKVANKKLAAARRAQKRACPAA